MTDATPCKILASIFFVHLCIDLRIYRLIDEFILPVRNQDKIVATVSKRLTNAHLSCELIREPQIQERRE